MFHVHQWYLKTNVAKTSQGHSPADETLTHFLRSFKYDYLLYIDIHEFSSFVWIYFTIMLILMLILMKKIALQLINNQPKTYIIDLTTCQIWNLLKVVNVNYVIISINTKAIPPVPRFCSSTKFLLLSTVRISSKFRQIGLSDPICINSIGLEISTRPLSHTASDEIRQICQRVRGARESDFQWKSSKSDSLAHGLSHFVMWSVSANKTDLSESLRWSDLIRQICQRFRGFHGLSDTDRTLSHRSDSLAPRTLWQIGLSCTDWTLLGKGGDSGCEIKQDWPGADWDAWPNG